MSYKVTNDLAELMVAPMKTALDGGRLYVFAGALPALPSDALNMATTHTQLAEYTIDGLGATGLTFAAAVDSLLAKNPSEDWEATVTFDGFVAAPGPATPTFFRFCPSGDDGRGAANTPRLQGTCGGPSSSADLRLGSTTLTDNGTNTTSVLSFNVRLSSLA